nr:unnamed protein product [Spirometra erinaceieuropaei]
MDILTRIIRRYDITVIQEIRDKSDTSFDVLIDYVNNCVSPRCGPKTHQYLGVTSDRYGRSVSKEQYGLLYRNVFNEMQYLHNISSRCMKPVGQANMIVTGDMNADCGYLSKEDKAHLNFVKDANYKWLITDDMDTTLASKRCAYDRFIVRGSDILSQLVAGSPQPFNFCRAYGIRMDKCLEVSDHFPIEMELREF